MSPWLNPTEALLRGGVLLILLVAAALDLRTRRIPNWLTFGSALAGLVVNAAIGQMEGVRWSAFGWFVGVLLLAIPFALRGVGAGDVKLLAAAGAWVGPYLAVATLLYGAIAGGVIALAVLLIRRSLGDVLRSVVLWVRTRLVFTICVVVPGALAWRVAGQSSLETRRLPRNIVQIPYGPALAIGGLLALVFS